MEGKTCCVTGHRDVSQKEINHIKTELQREVEKAVSDGFTRFMSGFADGVDQYFAEIVLELKKQIPPLIWWPSFPTGRGLTPEEA